MHASFYSANHVSGGQFINSSRYNLRALDILYISKYHNGEKLCCHWDGWKCQTIWFERQKKHPWSSSSVGEKTLLMRALRVEWLKARWYFSSSLQLSNFSNSAPTVASDSSSWLTRSGSWCGFLLLQPIHLHVQCVVCILKCFSAHHSCQQRLFV